jgi:hypothetical protein
MYRRRPKRDSLGAIDVLSTWLNRHGGEADPTENDICQLSKQTGVRPERVTQCLQHMRASYRSPIEQFLSSSSDEEPWEPIPEDETPHIHPSAFTHSAAEPMQFPASNTNALDLSLPPQDLDINTVGNVLSDTPLFPSLGGLVEPEAGFDFSPVLNITWPAPDIASWAKNQSQDAGPQVTFPAPEVIQPKMPGVTENLAPTPLFHTDQELRPGIKFKRLKNGGSPATFQCTFCHVRLTEGAWKRHEESQHLPRRKWVCLYTGPTVNGRCAFCERSPEPHGHHDHGRVTECAARDLEERSFLRKDGLVQHVMSFHGAAQLRPDVVAAWEVPAERREQDWVCGFCGETLRGWDTRATHLAAHFRQGMTMASWEA